MNARHTLLALLAALCVTAASAQAPPQAPVQAPVQVTDDAGQTLSLAQPARRIVSLAPHLTELLFSAGAGDRVVGAVAYSDHPAAAQTIPRIGDSAQLDLERIVDLRPDLVVVWHGGTPARQLERLRALRIPLYASEARRFDDIASTLRRLGTLAGTGPRAEAEALRFEREVAALRQRHADGAPLRVFYQIWSRPLMTVNGTHLISEALALCGARNVFAGLAPLVPTVDEEAVLAAAPDAIVTGAGESPGDPLASWRRLRGLRAALLTVDGDAMSRQSTRIVDGARGLCAQLDALRATRAATPPAR